MNNKAVSILIIIIIIAGGIFLFSNKSGAPLIDEVQTEESMTDAVDTETTMTEDSEGVKTFVIEGKNFSFAPNVMKVKVGDKVRITLKNVEGFHDLNIDELNVKTGTITVGKEVTVEFVADKAGSFEYYCAVGDHRAKGMVGTLTVEN